MLTRRGRRVHEARVLVTGVSVAGSAVLCFACSPSHAALWLVLLFVAQLATGPVLSLMYDLSGRRAGSAVLTAVYGKARWRRVALAAFVMNAASFGTGLLLNVGMCG